MYHNLYCEKCGEENNVRVIPIRNYKVTIHLCDSCREQAMAMYAEHHFDDYENFTEYLMDYIEYKYDTYPPYNQAECDGFVYEVHYDGHQKTVKQEKTEEQKKLLEEYRAEQEIIQKEKEKEEERKKRREKAEKRENALSVLNEFVGMNHIKSDIENWLMRIDGMEILKKTNIVYKDSPMHIVLTGNPGVGKTMLAKSLTKILFESGYINKEALFLYKAEDLVGQHLGHTAPKTKAAIQQAEGGVFFLDEAYRLSTGFNTTNETVSFGKEAIETIMGHLDMKKTVFIFAGYEDKMQGFLDANEGLRSRIKTHFFLKDYTLEELMQIALSLFKSRGYIADDIENILRQSIKSNMRQGILEGNGRTVTTYVDNIIDKHMLRISSIDYIDQEIDFESLQHILPEDVASAFNTQYYDQDGLRDIFEDAKTQIHSLIGMKEVKDSIERIANFQYIQEKRKGMGLKVETKSHHMVFLGNPGTGKTTVARMVGQLFRGANVLSNGHFVEATKDMLTSGESIPRKVKTLVDKAIGGILFIDEAYTLANDGKGKEALDALIPLMENRREEFICILAGYEQDMSRLFKLNEGLSSRIPYQFTFEDYNDVQLVEMFKKLLTKEGYCFSEETESTIKETFKKAYLNKETDGNGRWVRNFFENCLVAQSERLYRYEKSGNELTLQDFMYIHPSDIDSVTNKEKETV